jgi:biotin-dependent carboxylase-like uncharacterized protein
MSRGLAVLVPGLHSTIQDLGRRGYQNSGVPVCGPLDRIGLALANALVGNPANAPTLEIIVQGPVIEVAGDSVRLALVGGEGGLIVEGASARTVAPGQSVRVTRGDRVRVGPLGAVSCAYLAVEAGFDVPLDLGSAATYARGGFGGLHGRALLTGDVLPLRRDAVEPRMELRLAANFDSGLDLPVRLVLGPQQDYFTEEAVGTLLSAEFTISTRADRMGFRLDGPTLTHSGDYNIVSDGIVAGAIQVPGSGQPIVLLADAQTTGGYPKIATVISADLPLIGRRKPGGVVRFTAIGQGEAEAERRRQEQVLKQQIGDLRPVTDRAITDLAALYAANLIDGVVDAFN